MSFVQFDPSTGHSWIADAISIARNQINFGSRKPPNPHKINKPPFTKAGGLFIEISILGDGLAEVLPS
jgi:hypothetical protein